MTIAARAAGRELGLLVAAVCDVRVGVSNSGAWNGVEPAAVPAGEDEAHCFVGVVRMIRMRGVVVCLACRLVLTRRVLGSLDVLYCEEVEEIKDYWRATAIKKISWRWRFCAHGRHGRDVPDCRKLGSIAFAAEDA